jgi:ribonuclease HI
MIENIKPKVVIYTDGACIRNPGRGGYAAILSFGDNGEGKAQRIKHITGSHPWTTNNRMELMAFIAALEELKVPCFVELNTDSRYVLAVLNRVVTGKKKKKGQFPNYDLHERLGKAIISHDVEGKWVKGHADNRMNNIADELANSAAMGDR